MQVISWAQNKRYEILEFLAHKAERDFSAFRCENCLSLSKQIVDGLCPECYAGEHVHDSTIEDMAIAKIQQGEAIEPICARCVRFNSCISPIWCSSSNPDCLSLR